MNPLDEVTALSHEFGGDSFVKGGGGNTSVKDEHTLWVKPSGTTLAGIRSGDFVPLNRSVVKAMFGLSLPANPAEREEWVKNTLRQAVLKGCPSRPSVESPIHEILTGKFVVHTHPERVNGMTCSQRGREACKQLFPEALWVAYVDPGYTLCRNLQQRLDDHSRTHTRQPEIIFIENHGVFVNADSAAAIRSLYRHIMDTLEAEYVKQGIRGRLPAGVTDGEAQAREMQQLKTLMGDEARHVVSSPVFPVADRPLTPDHIVYGKAYPFIGAIDPLRLAGFKDEHGYFPKVIATSAGVYGAGPTHNSARLALELAADGAMVMIYAAAFGGIHYLPKTASDFIENWEVESYRRTQVA
jgi:rhamnose utilization protein RhaD (predicted bifunctional aldolase and dehydrogenase)